MSVVCVVCGTSYQPDHFSKVYCYKLRKSKGFHRVTTRLQIDIL